MAFYDRISAFIPRPIIEKFKKEMDYVGMRIPEENFVGFVFSFGILISFGIALNIFVFLQIPIYLTWPLVFILFAFIVYYRLNMVAESRARFVEKILPDILQLISSNMKSGLTTERALLASARPEFRVFAEELKLASAKVMAGERIEEALSDIASRIKSPTMERTIWLMVQGIKSGGEVADLLSQLADDLREENALKEETKAEVSMYVLLVFVAAAFGAPILFSVSSYIVGVLQSQTQNLAIEPEQLKEITRRSPVGRLGSMGIGQLTITPEFATMFAMISLLITCVCSSLVIGVINTGKEKDGVKFIPLITIMGVSLFYIIRFVLGMVLGNISALM